MSKSIKAAQGKPVEGETKTEGVNWAVVIPILIIMLAAIAYMIFF